MLEHTHTHTDMHTHTDTHAHAHTHTHTDNVNLESIKDEKERRQIESIINNFGQTPTQLFTEPHPQRLPLEAARRNQTKGFSSTFTGRRSLVDIFKHLNDLKAHCVDVSRSASSLMASCDSDSVGS